MIDFFKKLMEQALDLELTVRFTKRDAEWFAALGDELDPGGTGGIPGRTGNPAVRYGR